MLAERENKPIPQPETLAPIDFDASKKIAGRYAGGNKAFDLIERADGGLYIMNTDGGFESRLRALGDAIVIDDKFAFGTRVVPSDNGGSVTVGGESFKRVSVGKPAAVPDK